MDRVAASSGDLLQSVFHAALEDGVELGFRALAEQLRSELDCDLVILGARRGMWRRCRIQSISGVAHFQRHSALASCAEEVLAETLLCERPVFYAAEQSGPTATEARRQLTSLCHARMLVSGAILNGDGEKIGAWAALSRAQREFAEMKTWAERTADGAESLSTQLNLCLSLLERTRPALQQRMACTLFGANSRRRRRVVSAIVAGLVCMMALPVPYRVTCDCEVQTMTRRSVSMPYAGVIKTVLAEPGDAVSKGQVLARMDEREIALELASLQAGYEQAEKQHAVELAGQRAAAAQIAQLEMDRLAKRIELLQERASNLEIRSPIDGVVLQGDAKKQENARLSMGETLFEIGPLGNMLVDILVPDEEISNVKPEQEVAIRLDALANGPRDGVLRRVSPQAEVRGQRNVFVAEAELDNGDGSLRPGMKGDARISTKARPLGWNLFHKAWNRLTYVLPW